MLCFSLSTGPAIWGMMLPDLITDNILQNTWHNVLIMHACSSLPKVFPSAAVKIDAFLGVLFLLIVYACFLICVLALSHQTTSRTSRPKYVIK